MRAHVVRISGGLIHAGHEGRATRGASRSRGKDTREARAAGSERIDIRRLDVFRAVAAEIEFYILGNDPEDVGPPRRRGILDSDGQRNERQEENNNSASRGETAKR